MSKTSKNIIIGILSVLLIMNIFQNVNMKQLNIDLTSKMDYELRALHDQIQDLNKTMYDTKYEIEKENLWIREATTDYMDLGNEDVDVTVTFAINDRRLDEELKLVVSKIKSDRTFEVFKEMDIDKESVGRIQTSLVLPIEFDYSLDLIGQSNQGVRSTTVSEILIQSELRRRFYFDIDLRQKNIEDPNSTGHFYISNEPYEFINHNLKMNNGHFFEEDEGYVTMDNLSIEELTLEIYLNDRPILRKGLDDAMKDDPGEEDAYDMILDFEEAKLQLDDQISYVLNVEDAGGRRYTFTNTINVDIDTHE